MATKKNNTVSRVKGKRVMEARVVTKGFSGKLTFDEFEGLSELCDVSHVGA